MSKQLELEQKPFIELQIEALIKENRIKQKLVDKFVNKLESRLVGIQEKEYSKKLNRPLRVPLIGRPNSLGQDVPTNFTFIPPQKVHVVGGFKTSTAIKKTSFVDLAVCIPSKCLDKKDVKNHRYQTKRAFYLAQLAFILARQEAGDSSDSVIEKLEFRYHQGDILKPVLLITPKDEKLRENTIFQIFVCLDQDAPLKISMFQPSHGNVAAKWFFEHFPFDNTLTEELEAFTKSDSDAYPTPFYNSGILFDFEMLANSDILNQHIGAYQSLKEALLLIKIWLYQRELNNHFSFVLSMYVAHLQANRIIHQNMSSYQIFKMIIKTLGNEDWAAQGISYYDDLKDKIPSFSKHFPVVFLSPSGNFNLCYNIPSDIYNRLKHEVRQTHDILAKNSTDTFDHLFLKKIDFATKFDVIVHLPKITKKLPMNMDFLHEFLDRGAILPAIYSKNILRLTHRGLTDRVSLIQQNLDHLLLNRRWNYRSIPFDPIVKEHSFTFGLLLEPEKSLRIIDIGPEAQTKEAAEFRSFWEPKSQLRLQDGIISETVVWHVKSFSQRRAIIKYILTLALKHADINHLQVHYTTLDRFVSLKNVYFEWKENREGSDRADSEKATKTSRHKPSDDTSPMGVGEEVFQKVLKGYNELNKAIRSMDLKCAITSIHAISPILRNCSVFPPMPVCLQAYTKSLKRKRGVSTFPDDFNETGKILHIEPIDILLCLESTGKWPNDFDALQASKLDCLIQLGECLKEREYSVKFSKRYLDVLHGQFVFRIHLKCPKELMLTAPNRYKHELQKLRFALEVEPRVNAALDRLYREEPAFSLTCRLVKRWISCHLLTDHIGEITLELIVAHQFLHPEPLSKPGSSICGFRRFMLLMAHHDWTNVPLVVNFDNQLKLDELARIKNSLQEDRSKLPAMVVCTPFDKDTSPWTRDQPTLPMLDLLRRVCGKAAEFIKKDILFNLDSREECKALFRPNFKLFNLIIKLNSKRVQNTFMSVDAHKGFSLKGREPDHSGPSSLKVMPIVGLNLIECYVKALRQKYDKVALFFYDKYGQRVIGVVMKPESEQILDGDLAGFIAGMKELGAKLVESINIVKHEE